MKAENNAVFNYVVNSVCMLLVRGRTGEQPEKSGKLFNASAEKYAVGTFLESIKNGLNQPLAFFRNRRLIERNVVSGKFLGAEHRYSSCCVSAGSSFCFCFTVGSGQGLHVNHSTYGLTGICGSDYASKEKGADCGHALWVSSAKYLADVKSAKNLADHFSPFNCLASCCAIPTSSLRWSPACTPISPIRSSASSAPLRLVKSFSSPFSLSWRRAISPCMAVTMNCPVLSSWRFTASIPSITSWGIRAATACDFAFLVPVAIASLQCSWCRTVYIIGVNKKALTCSTPILYFVYTTLIGCRTHGSNKQHHQHIDRSPVHAFHHQHWQFSYGVGGRRKHSISNRDKGAFQGVMCASVHADWQGIKTAKPGSVGALNRASDHNQTVR